MAFSNPPSLDRPSSAFIDLYFGKNLQRIFLKDFQFVIRAQEIKSIDYRDHVVRWFAGIFADRAAGAGRFGAEQDLIDAALFDGGFQIIFVVDTGIEE